jgi:DNA-binding beta-propeller fold protein YncE
LGDGLGNPCRVRDACGFVDNRRHTWSGRGISDALEDDEVVDLMAGKVTKHISNLRTPQGIGFAPESNRLAVANDQDGSCRLYDGTSLQQTATVDLKDDADNVRYDNVSRRFWVGYGDGGLAAIDPESGKQVADVKLHAHPESFQLETKGKQIFVNVPNAGYVAVVDRETATVIEKFPLKGAAANFPMALDEADHRLVHRMP